MGNFLRFLGLYVALSACATALAQSVPSAYDQTFRPQVHFSPQQHWTNDPNGLVFFEGEYHLFYQYNPEGDVWGHMSWGHAVSPDLLHWRELPLALAEHDGEMIFTGSVVVDERNTSGFCKSGAPCLVAIYTSHRSTGVHPQTETQSIAYSVDRGRTWKFYDGNPVLDLQKSDFRDPGVTWNRLTNDWLMVVSLPNEHQILFYKSPDLKHWTKTSVFGPQGAVAGQWECPSLLEVPQKAGEGSIWALKVGLNPGGLQGGSGEQYFLGNFDGKAFSLAPGKTKQSWTDYGKDSYCAISYNHLPPGAPPVLIGWMNNWEYADKLPTSPWRGQMTIPRELRALHDADGMSLAQTPVTKEVRSKTSQTVVATLKGDELHTSLLETNSPAELRVSFSSTDSHVAGLRLYSDDSHWTEIGFDLEHNTFYVDRVHAGIDVTKAFPVRTEAPLAKTRPFDLDLVLDRSSVEAFAQSGTIAMTNLIFPVSPTARIEVFRAGGTLPVKIQGEAWRLNSVWTNAVTQH